MSNFQAIQQAVERYLQERRQLGFDLQSAGTELLRFARFADARHHTGPLTLTLQIDWAREHVSHTSEITGARRLEILRPFAAHYSQFEPMTAIPPPHCLGRAHRRLTPHIYTQGEIVDLMIATGSLASTYALRPITYRTLFGLIAATGLRLSEALNLVDSDVDLNDNRLTVRQTKFNKSRCLPIQASVVDALTQYRSERRRRFRDDKSAPFIVSEIGARLPKSTVHYVFRGLRHRLGWTARGDHDEPRIHDLRHTFAVNYVLNWHRQGLPIDQGMLWLCTYLGHAKISDTYWYLSGTPELLAIVADRFERFTLPAGGHHA